MARKTIQEFHPCLIRSLLERLCRSTAWTLEGSFHLNSASFLLLMFVDCYVEDRVDRHATSGEYRNNDHNQNDILHCASLGRTIAFYCLILVEDRSQIVSKCCGQ